MSMYSQVIIGLLAIIHIYILWFEMFAWTTKGKKVFRNFDSSLFEKTKSMAANQGLYNGFLAAGLIWSLLIHEHPWNFYIAIFFLSCILIAGIYGSLTADKKILYVQAIPAAIGLILLHL